VGSAGYYRDDIASEKMEPKYDAAGDGERQPGSAWKPIVYATAFEHGVLTPASLLLDITTAFGKHDDGKAWAPRDADRLDRGPVLVRKALQYSLNVPAIRALERIGNEAVAKQAEAMGIRFQGGSLAYLRSGLAGAIGTVEVRPLDLTSAYGTLANGGQYLPPQMIVQILDSKGNVVWEPPHTAPAQAISPQAAFVTTDILAGNTDPGQNPIWAEKTMLTNGPGGSRRPAAVKTGTANDARDLATYGYLPQPRTKGVPGLAVGIWMGNSDHSNPRPRRGLEAATSLTAAAPLWRAFVRDLSNEWPVEQFRKPDGVVTARADGWSGGAPGPWTTRTIEEYFIEGTQPGAGGSPDRPGLLYSVGCGAWRVDPLKAELGPREWDADVADWIRRASRGAGVTGQHDSTTAYFWGESSWGGSVIGGCRPFGGDFGNGSGRGNGNGNNGNGNGNGNGGNDDD
jgi:penicillin-binding protein 1A